MKKLLVLTLLVMPACLFAQQKIEQYCQLTAQNPLTGTKVTLDVDFGEAQKIYSFKDTTIKADLQKVKSFNNLTSALNYMGSRGWTFVNALMVTDANKGFGRVYYYYFKKEFDLSELEKAI